MKKFTVSFIDKNDNVEIFEIKENNINEILKRYKDIYKETIYKYLYIIDNYIKNQNYIIINSMAIKKNKKVVIAYNEKAPQKWVVWYLKDDDYYYFGKYTNNFEEAIKIFFERVECEK